MGKVRSYAKEHCPFGAVRHLELENHDGDDDRYDTGRNPAVIAETAKALTGIIDTERSGGSPEWRAGCQERPMWILTCAKLVLSPPKSASLKQ
jgi:hypothetical protein